MSLSHHWLSRIFILLTALTSAHAHASDDTLKVGLLDFPPYYIQTEGQPPSGELVELLAEIMARLDRKWDAEFYPVPRLLSHIVEGQVHLSMLIRHPMLIEKALYGHSPVGRLVLKAYHRPGFQPLNNVTDLRGQHLIVIRGYGYGGLIDQFMAPQRGGTLQVAASHRQAFEMLMSGQGDYLLDYLGPATRTMDELQLTGLDGGTLQDKDVYFVLSRKLANAEILLQDLEQAMKD